MPSAVAFRDTTSGAGGNASRTFPSLMPSKFCQRSDVGFMQLVEEASRPTRNSHISIANMEPFLLKNAVSNSNSLHQVSNQDSDKDIKDNNSNSFDWSRNINRLRDEQRASSRERRGDKSHSNSVTPELRRMGSRWRGDGIMTSTRMDAITGRDPLSELVVELNSRECSPHAKPKTASRWPSVVSVHGRPISSSRRNRRGSIGKDKSNHGLSLLPQILKNNDKKGRRVPPLPTNSEETFDEWVTEQERKIMNNPRTPMKSRRPQQPGQPRSPLLSRSPRHSVSRPGEDILAGQRTARNTPSPDFDFDDSENTETEPSSPSDRSSINTNSEAGTPSSGMGMMGTMLSNYPRTPHDGGPLGMVVSVLGAPSDPVGGGPVQAWNATFSNHHNNTQNSNKVSKGSRVFPWTKGTKTVNAIKVSWAVMMEVGVQTEAVTEEELDWDLSNKEDRETQTLPPNPTHFQLNRKDAFVQTDYRYFPLMTHAPRPSTHITIKTVDKETQTETTTTSVSTQTEAPYLMPIVLPPSPIRAPSSSLSEEIEEVLHSDASSGPSTSGLGSALPRRPPQIVEVLPCKKVVVASLQSSPTHTSQQQQQPPLSLPFNGKEELRDRCTAAERWSRLQELGSENIMATESHQAHTRTHRIRRLMVDVSVQTDNDILTDEAPQFAARPPTSTKAQLMAGVDFTDLDVHVLTTPDEVTTDTTNLVRYLCEAATDDLDKLRVLFRWVTENIRFDWKYMDKNQSVDGVLGSRAGVSKDYVNVLVELCQLAGFRVKKINGFARGRDFRIGRKFEPEKDPQHAWMAVFLYGSWRLLDPTFGAGYTDHQGRFNPHPQEHYFLTDPNQMIHTHFPYHNTELQYHRWQLLQAPLSLEDFNALPKVTPDFWSVGLRLRKPNICPVVFNNQTEITLIASALVRFKYKFFPANQSEEECVNQWVFCTMKEEGAVGSFTVLAPAVDTFILKVYAGKEELLEDEGSALNHVASFLLVCEKARRYPMPWPIHDVAWGPTPRLYECGIDPINQPGPIILTWGGKKLLTFEKAFDVMLMFQVFDAKGAALEQKGMLGRQETDDQVRLVIVPPGIGYFKLLMYGIPRPQVRGRWRLPLLASYLIECKMSLGHPVKEVDPDKPKKSKRKIKLARR